MNFIHVPELDVNPSLSPGSVLARQNRRRLGSAACRLQECVRRRIREGKDNVMIRKSIIALAAVATLGLAALASGPASARGHFGGHFGGHMRMGGFRMGGFHQMAFRHRFFVRRFAVIRAPIFIGNGCWRVRWVHVHHHWRRHRIWVCG
jgi:hypothetical protein